MKTITLPDNITLNAIVKFAHEQGCHVRTTGFNGFKFVDPNQKTNVIEMPVKPRKKPLFNWDWPNFDGPGAA